MSEKEKVLKVKKTIVQIQKIQKLLDYLDYFTKHNTEKFNEEEAKIINEVYILIENTAKVYEKDLQV